MVAGLLRHEEPANAATPPPQRCGVSSLRSLSRIGGASSRRRPSARRAAPQWPTSPFFFSPWSEGFFPSQQELTKHVCDRLQEFDSKTLLCSIPMSVGCDWALKRFEELVDDVDRCRVDGAPLHLKIKAYHVDIARGDRQKTQLMQSEIGELLVPQQWSLKHIDPEGKLPFSEVKQLVVQRAYQYYQLIVERKTEGEYDLLDALELYESFYYLHRQTTWGEFPVGCVCLGSCKWTLCEHTALVTSLFRSDVMMA